MEIKHLKVFYLKNIILFKIINIFNNANHKVNAYKYNESYYILKNYSRFNIYDSKGQEIEQKYTDGTLRNAKINLIYYLSNLTVTEQAI